MLIFRLKFLTRRRLMSGKSTATLLKSFSPNRWFQWRHSSLSYGNKSVCSGRFGKNWHFFKSISSFLVSLYTFGTHLLFFNTRPSAPTKSKCSSCCGSLFFLFAPLARSRSKRTNFQGDAPFELYTERRAKICFQREVRMHIHTLRGQWKDELAKRDSLCANWLATLVIYPQ